MSLSSSLFGRDSFIFKVGNVLGLGLPGYLDKKFGPPEIEGPRLEDLTVQSSTFGAPIGRVYGIAAVLGNVIWLENNRIKETVKKKKQGGKGGGASEPTKTYSYSATFAVGLCDAPPEGITAVRRVWIGPDLIYNTNTDDLETLIASSKVTVMAGTPSDDFKTAVKSISGNNGIKFAVYPGTDDQMPDYRIEAEMGVGNAPAFRGTAYIIFYDLPLAKYGNSIAGAQVKVELVTVSNANGPCTAVSTWSNDLLGFAGIGGDRGSINLRNGIIYNYEGSNVVRKYRLNGNGAGVMSVPTPVGYEHRGRAHNNPLLQLVNDTVDGHLFVVNHGDGSFVLSAIRSEDDYYCNAGGGGSEGLLLDLGENRLVIGCVENTTNDGLLLLFDGAHRIAQVKFGTYINTLSTCCVDDSGNIWLHLATGSLRKYSSEDLTLIQSWSVGAPAHYTDGAPSIAVVGKYAYLRINGPGSPASVHELHDDGSFTVTCSLPDGGYAMLDGGMVVGLTNPARFYLPGVDNGTSETLANVVEKELLSSGMLESSDIDVTDLLLDEVPGYIIAGQKQIRANLEPLQIAWPFDLVMSGYQIKAVRRGKSSVKTILAENLDARMLGQDISDMLDISREMDTQLPRQVYVRHLDPSREYDINEQRSVERFSTQSVEKKTIDLPLSLTSTEAARVADVLFNVAWLERLEFAFRATPDNIDLEPADVVTVTTDYASFDIRLSEISYTRDGMLECSGTLNSAANYTSVAQGGDGNDPDGSIALTSTPEFLLVDIPLIRNDDDELGFCAVMSGTTSAWDGGYLARSNDNGQTWSEVQSWSTPATFGTARDTLSSHDCFVMDRTSTLQVDLLAGEVESITEAQMMTGLNWCAYGADGRWELMQFTTATLETDGSYTLSNFLRGLRGTEWATGLHEAGDYFVFLDDPDTMVVGADIASVGVTRLWAGLSFGQSIDDGVQTEFAYTAANLKPLSVVNLDGSLSGGGDWEFTFDPRSRLSSALWTLGTAIPVGETTEQYEIDMAGTDGVVVRTLTATTSSLTYTEAQQIEDFGSIQQQITATVYQMSSVVGRGFPAAGTFTATDKTRLLLHFEGTNESQAIADSSVYAVPVTVTGTTNISTASAAIGSASGLFDGNGDYLTADFGSAVIGTGDFTLEFFVKRNGNTNAGTASSGILVDMRTAEPSEQIMVDLSGSTASPSYAIGLYINGSYRARQTSGAMNNSSYHHVAVVRKSGVIRLYVGGTQVGSNYTSSADFTASVMTIGGRFADTSGDRRSLNGNIDELRLRLEAVYDGTFTPPSSALS